MIKGILTTSSYEARAYGVKTGMRIKEALALCPQLIIKAPDMPLYQELSYDLYKYLCKNIPLVEQASIDEFYGDLQGWIEDDEVEKFIKTLQLNIYEDLSLPVSIGASSTKYIAKLVTSFAKPFGYKIVYKNEITDFVKDIKSHFQNVKIFKPTSSRDTSAEIYVVAKNFLEEK